MAEEWWCERNSSSEQMQELPPTVLWLLISPGRSCLRVGERNGVSTLKSVLDLSPRFQWYLNRDVGASCSSSDTYSVGKPAHKHHERTFQRQKIHQQSLNSIFTPDIFCYRLLFFFFFTVGKRKETLVQPNSYSKTPCPIHFLHCLNL